VRTRPDHSRQRQEFSKRPLIEQVKDMLSLHTSERRGFAALIVLLFSLFVIVVYLQWLRPPAITDMGALRTDLQLWLAKRDSANRALEARAMEQALFPFDPNTIDEDEWLKLGLSPKQAASITRYRSKGGRFRTKADLGRMYSLRPQQVERLTPYVMLPDSQPARASNKPERRNGKEKASSMPRFEPDAASARPQARIENRQRKVEVNSADTADLIALPGIGPAFARGIVKYRESLGGYVSMDQLAEVYVLKDKPDALARLAELLTIDAEAARRIPLNSCTVEQLAAHPYARWRIAKPLVAYRQQHGPFRSIDDIRVIPVIDETAFRKLAPYLSLE